MPLWQLAASERAPARLTVLAALLGSAVLANASLEDGLGLPPPGAPPQPPRAEREPPVRARLARIDPSTLLQLALLQNSDVLYARLQADVAAQGYAAETGLYQPTGYASARRDGRSRPRTVEERITAALGGIARLEELGKAAEAGVRMRAPSGAEVSLGLRSTKRESNVIGSAPFAQGNSESSGAFVLTLKQPLLRGMGRQVNETDLRVAEVEREIGIWQLRQQVLRVGSDTLSAYWQLQRAVQAQGLRQQALENARALVEDTRARITGGRLPVAAQDEAGATLAARQAELARGAVAVAEAEARVRQLLDLPPDDGGWTMAPPSPAPVAAPPAADFSQRVAAALDAWPPLRIAQLRRTQALDRLKLAQDRQRPGLDLQFSYSTNSLTPSGIDAASQALKGKNPDWSIGMSMELPLGEDRRAQAQARAQLLRVEQSELEMRTVRQALASDLVSRAQQLDATLRERAQVDQDVRARQALYDADELQFRNGSAPLNRLLRRQADVLEAQLRLVDAHARMELARVALQLTDGTLLKAHEVRFEN